MPVFKARYKGNCSRCGQSIEQGQFISWSRRKQPGQPGAVYHANCSDPFKGEPGTGEQPAPDAQPGPESGQGEQGEPQPQPGQPAGPSEARVRDIAREVAQAEDVAHTKTMLDAVEERLSKHVPRTLEITVRKGDEATKLPPIENAHAMLKRLVYLVSKRQHAYLYGPPGSGKSAGAVMAAKALGLRYGYVSLNPQTPESRLLGFIDAGGTYRETEFFRCYTAGGVFCIDELDNGHPALLNTLNGMLESDADGIGRGAFPCGVVERHADFVCVATGNTNGNGGDKLFPERRALDSAFKERFVFIAWGYDEALEQAITLSINKNAGAWLAWVRAVRAYVARESIRTWASPRASFKGADLMRDSGWTAREIADAVLFKGLDVDTVKRIIASCPLPTL